MRSHKIIYFILVFVLVLLVTNCGKKEETQMTDTQKAAAVQKEEGKKAGAAIIDYEKIDIVKAQIAKLAPVKITYDASNLTDKEKKVLILLVKAAK